MEVELTDFEKVREILWKRTVSYGEWLQEMERAKVKPVSKVTEGREILREEKRKWCK